MRSQLLAAQIALGALVLGVLTAVFAVAGVRLGTFSYALGRALMIPATALGLAALGGALTWLGLALTQNRGAGKRLGAIALAGSLAFLYPPLGAAWQGMTAPPIHDATSDPDDAPQFVALAKIPAANSRVFDGQHQIHYRGQDMTIAYALHEYYPLLTKPHAGLLLSPQTAFQRCLDTAKALGWRIDDASEKDLRIEASDRSFWFGQISDIVIRVRPAGAIGSRVDIRSESRAGDTDQGRNAARIKAFFHRLGL